ncbi:hypothetical protein [Saliterribacillus persicus]|uniref:Uncharacterized protein n=1 Tax=Saliterribacillus persicus TaxID=930114 RepID=A0A368XVN2_9BACI|nr:hypothetical protein [Saliterribacillus persicus]RCW72023.1 hypothetical protein DFR57_105208 [Saliterribacillus persicus]
MLNEREKKWGIIIAIIIFLGYLLPYTLLREVTAWYGSFLLWAILGIIIIWANIKLTQGWGEEE